MNRPLTDARRMFQHVLHLAACGPRHPASTGDHRSRDYLLAQAADLHLPGWTLPVRVNAFTPGSASLLVEGDAPRAIECLPQDRSGSTPADGVRARLVYAGLGRPEDYQGLDVAGAIVLQEIWGLHMTLKVSNALAHGALGCVWIHDHPGGQRSAWGLGSEQSPLPVVSVSQEDGRWLQALCAEDSVTVTLRCAVETAPATSDHVMIKLPAATGSPTQGPVLLVAHRDTTHVSPGANDNASGCAVVLEVLRTMQEVGLPFDLIGLLTTAEEGGGIGIRQIAARLATGDYAQQQGEGPNATLPPTAAFDLDMLSVGGPMRLVTGSATRETDAQLNALLREAAAELGYYLEDYVCPMGLADAGPLLEAGIPSTWLFKPDDPRFHTGADTPEHVNANDMKVAADLVCWALARLGGVW